MRSKRIEVSCPEFHREWKEWLLPFFDSNPVSCNVQHLPFLCYIDWLERDGRWLPLLVSAYFIVALVIMAQLYYSLKLHKLICCLSVQQQWDCFVLRSVNLLLHVKTYQRLSFLKSYNYQAYSPALLLKPWYCLLLKSWIAERM